MLENKSLVPKAMRYALTCRAPACPALGQDRGRQAGAGQQGGEILRSLMEGQILLDGKY